MFTDSNLQSPPSFTNPNLQPLNLELTPEREQSLIEFADWWGDRMIVTIEELNAFPGYSKLQTKYGKGYPYYTLLTHNCGNDEKKTGILKLGGVIYWPDSEQTQFYGSDAANQLKASMGVKVHGMGSYGGVKDGYTFVYLHPIPYELYEDAQVYLEGPNGFALARAFSDNPPNWQTSKTNLDSVLQAPFVVLDAWLTNESNLINLIKYLPKYKEQLLKDPKFRYKLRMTENKYLIGIV